MIYVLIVPMIWTATRFHQKFGLCGASENIVGGSVEDKEPGLEVRYLGASARSQSGERRLLGATAPSSQPRASAINAMPVLASHDTLASESLTLVLV